MREDQVTPLTAACDFAGGFGCAFFAYEIWDYSTWLGSLFVIVAIGFFGSLIKDLLGI